MRAVKEKVEYVAHHNDSAAKNEKFRRKAIPVIDILILVVLALDGAMGKAKQSRARSRGEHPTDQTILSTFDHFQFRFQLLSVAFLLAFPSFPSAHPIFFKFYFSLIIFYTLLQLPGTRKETQRKSRNSGYSVLGSYRIATHRLRSCDPVEKIQNKNTKYEKRRKETLVFYLIFLLV